MFEASVQNTEYRGVGISCLAFPCTAVRSRIDEDDVNIILYYDDDSGRNYDDFCALDCTTVAEH